jgi:DMSO/TMAO reductase YedYZ molybdopterin-dependent catalytic subunit
MRPASRIVKITLMAVFFAQIAAFGFPQTALGSVRDEPAISIFGLVDNLVNITYGELMGLPFTSVNATCTCVGWPPEDVGVNAYEVYTYNWTGVRVSVLLEIAGVKPGALDMVFYASDGFSSSLSLEKANAEDTIIAVLADGEPLTIGTGYPFRLVVPCWWGYKWVKYVERIELVDYDYRGTWESAGFPDEAKIPDCETEKDEKGLNPVQIGMAASGAALLGMAAYMIKKKSG